MRFGDEFDELDDEIFSIYGIDSYDEEVEEDYESMGSFIDEDEE